MRLGGDRVRGPGRGLSGGGRRTRWTADLRGTPGVVTALPSGLTFTRAAGTAYGQSSSSALFSATANQPRRIYTSAGNGLLLCRSTTNLFQSTLQINNGFAFNWNAGSSVTTFTAGLPGPDGTASAARAVAASAGYGPFQILGATINTLPFTLSAFLLRGASVDVNHQGLAYGSTLTNTTQLGTATWAPWSASAVGGAASYGFAWDGRALGGATANAIDSQLAFIMLETTPYRRMPVVSPQGTTGTIAGDVLSNATASAVIRPDGSISLKTRFIPQGSSAQLQANGKIWYYDASNFAEVVASTRKIAITVAGVTYTAAGAANWSAYDVVDLQVSAGGGVNRSVVTLWINGGAAQVLGTSGAAQGTIPSAGSIYLGCASDATGQLDAIFQRFEAF